MSEIIELIQNNISAFDLIVSLITIYSMAQCAAKGFMMSLLSFSKWLLALIITIVLVPKLNPWIQDSLFIIINIGKAISKAVTYTGLGSVDKSFGLIFGIFKGYIICVCIFSLLNWFYPHKKWPIETEGTYSFKIIYKGSVFLVDEFPNSKDYYDQTEEKLEKI